MNVFSFTSKAIKVSKMPEQCQFQHWIKRYEFSKVSASKRHGLVNFQIPNSCRYKNIFLQKEMIKLIQSGLDMHKATKMRLSIAAKSYSYAIVQIVRICQATEYIRFFLKENPKVTADVQQLKKMNHLKINKPQKMIQKDGKKPNFYIRWTPEENIAYANFLQRNVCEDWVSSRKTSKLFIRMAKQLQNGRDNLQCRSHHVKMIKKYGSLQQVMKEFLEIQKENKASSKQIFSESKNTVENEIPSNASIFESEIGIALTEANVAQKAFKEISAFEEPDQFGLIDIMDIEFSFESIDLFTQLSGPAFFFNF